MVLTQTFMKVLFKNISHLDLIKFGCKLKIRTD